MLKRTHLGGIALGSFLLLLVLLAGHEPPGTAADAKPAEPQRKAAEPELEWHRPRFAEHGRERARMVGSQIARRGVSDPAVLSAMRNVPRHRFVPGTSVRAAYADRPLSIGHGQTISQPYIVAYMTEALGLKAGEKVLEIGTGSGYQAAILSEITPHIYTVEIIRALGRTAAARLARLTYKVVQCKVADGYFGWAEHAPYDAIIVTCAAGTIPPPLVKQLKAGGRMCIPVAVSGRFQRLVLVTRDAKGKTRTKSLMSVRFVPLTRRLR